MPPSDSIGTLRSTEIPLLSFVLRASSKVDVGASGVGGMFSARQRDRQYLSVLAAALALG
jgi:hypothetical protein